MFLKEERHVYQLIESGVFIRDAYVQVSSLSTPSTRITVSGVPPFVPNNLLENELRRSGKFSSAFAAVSLRCRDPKLKHVQSVRQQVFMFLDSPTQTLEASFRVKHGDGYYMVYASSGQLKCFECGHVGHKRVACPHKQQTASVHSECSDGAVLAAAPGTAESNSAVVVDKELDVIDTVANESVANLDANADGEAGRITKRKKESHCEQQTTTEAERSNSNAMEPATHPQIAPDKAASF